MGIKDHPDDLTVMNASLVKSSTKGFSGPRIEKVRLGCVKKEEIAEIPVLSKFMDTVHRT
jgi:hypothetical protein